MTALTPSCFCNPFFFFILALGMLWCVWLAAFLWSSAPRPPTTQFAATIQHREVTTHADIALCTRSHPHTPFLLAQLTSGDVAAWQRDSTCTICHHARRHASNDGLYHWTCWRAMIHKPHLQHILCSKNEHVAAPVHMMGPHKHDADGGGEQLQGAFSRLPHALFCPAFISRSPQLEHCLVATCSSRSI